MGDGHIDRRRLQQKTLKTKPKKEGRPESTTLPSPSETFIYFTFYTMQTTY